MKVFVLIMWDHGCEDDINNKFSEILSFKNKEDAINHVLNYYKDCEYDKEYLDEVQGYLEEDGYYYEQNGNDPVEWNLVETVLK